MGESIKTGAFLPRTCAVHIATSASDKYLVKVAFCFERNSGVTAFAYPPASPGFSSTSGSSIILAPRDSTCS